jgi:hypothetical protein
MSDTVLRIVPADPGYRARQELLDAMVSLLQSRFPDAEAIEASSSPTIQFIDAGENWGGVSCSCCGADAQPWWGKAMDKAWHTQFQSLNVVAECCGQVVSLNALIYGWPIAFANVRIEVRNPPVTELSSALLAQLALILGCEVRVVQAYI